MNKPEVFENAELGSVRVVMVEEAPYFVGKDVQRYWDIKIHQMQ